MEEYDVLVVGAGPGGSSAARKCTSGGLKTLLIERMKLPRRKACSGIITNVSQNYILENFGPIPDKIFGKPYISKGMAFYFPSSGTVFGNVDCYNLYVWRDKFDYFLASSSGAKLQDETSFIRLEQVKDKYEVTLKSKGKKRKITAKYIVGADGGRSRVTQSVAPEVFKKQEHVWAAQKYFEGTKDINEHYLYWMINKGFGPFPWANMKDGQLIIGLTNPVGVGFNDMFSRYIEFLKKNFGLKIKRELATEGCVANLGTTVNKFFPGRGNVIMVGDACGFVNMGHCSISSAMVSGTSAGEAIAEGLKTNADSLEIYKKKVEPEMINTLDQWNPFRMLNTAGSGRYRQPSVFHGYSFPKRLKMMGELVGFAVKEFKPLKNVLPIMGKQVIRRSIFRKYKLGIMD
jgi:flavin-dependent dehydrogenase